MTDDVRTALDDLLAVHALDDVTPVRVQRWQAAVTALLAPEKPAKADKFHVVKTAAVEPLEG